jgi:predicted dehydrogenase
MDALLSGGVGGADGPCARNSSVAWRRSPTAQADLRNDRRGGEVDVDDAFEAFVEFEQGAIGTLEASHFAVGRGHSARHGTREAVTYRAGRATVAEPG